MKLTFLGIELCALLCHGANEQTVPTIVNLYRKCTNLKALDMRVRDCCDRYGETDILLLSNFASLIHLYADITGFLNSISIKHILSGRKMLKYLVCLSHPFYPSSSLQPNYNLELMIKSFMTDIPDTFMGYISVHGRLTHVVMHVGSVTFDGVITLIGNSPNLVKCCICPYNHDIPFCALQDFNQMLKKKFSNRKLFCGGHYYFDNKTYCGDFLTMHNTELTSL